LEEVGDVYKSTGPRAAPKDHYQCGKWNDWSSSVNLDEAIDIGRRQMEEFERNCLMVFMTVSQ